MVKISDIANCLGVSQTTIYKKARKLEAKLAPLTQKIEGVLWFDPKAVDVFRAAIQTAASETTMITTVKEEPFSPGIDALREELSEIRAAVLHLAEENAALRREIRQRDTPEGAFRMFYSSFFRPVSKVFESCRDRYYHAPLMLAGPDNVVPLFAGQRESQ